MPYPFIYHPTYGEFAAQLAEAEVVAERVGDNLCFARLIGDETLTATLHVLDVDDRVTPSEIKSTCRRLKLDPGNFGLILD